MSKLTYVHAHMCDAGSGLHLDCGPTRTRTHIYTVPDIEACEVGGVWLNRLGRCSARETHPIWVGSTLWTALKWHKGLRGSLRAVPEVRHVNSSVFDCQNFDSPPMSMQYMGADPSRHHAGEQKPQRDAAKVGGTSPEAATQHQQTAHVFWYR